VLKTEICVTRPQCVKAILDLILVECGGGIDCSLKPSVIKSFPSMRLFHTRYILLFFSTHVYAEYNIVRLLQIRGDIRRGGNIVMRCAVMQWADLHSIILHVP